MRNPGALLCLASGAAFGAMAIFGKLAYQEGATVGTLLAVRFALAALLFWALVARSGGLRRLRAISRRDIALALALGAVGYSAQAGAYFAALRRMDASLLSLLLYTFPAIVTVALSRSGASASVRARRRRWPWRRSASSSYWRCRGPGRLTRWAPRWRSARPSSTAPISWSRRAW